MRIIVNTALIALVFLAYALFATVGRAATSKTAPLALVVTSEVIATLSERWHRASRHQHRHKYRYRERQKNPSQGATRLLLRHHRLLLLSHHLRLLWSDGFALHPDSGRYGQTRHRAKGPSLA
jgi:hypothetical protein